MMKKFINFVEKPENASWGRDFLLLFCGILGFFCIGLGARPYITPSEGRYIEIPRQILATGDWLTPHLNGVQYFEKPPLFYWMQAVFLSIGEVLGEGEFWGRIATALVVVFTCLVTYAVGRIIYNRRAGVLASLALATSILGYGLSRVSMLDAPVSLFLTCTIASFLFAQKTGKVKFYYLMYVAAALAVMTKGLIGIVIPAMVIGSWILLTKNWQILKQARLFTGLLLFLAIAAPWHILMARAHPEFANFYFIHEHFERFLTSEHKRTAPWWFFIAVTFAGFFPYWFVTPQLFRGLWKKTENLFLLLWILLPLLFFSSSHSKLVPYIFPIFPPLFVLIGKRLSDMWDSKKKLIISVFVLMAVVEISANYIAPQFDKRTIKPLAEIINKDLKTEDLVVAYNSYWQDLPIYLNRNITVSGWTGELNFGVEHTPNAKDWMISDEEFLAKCAGAKTKVFVLMREEDFANLTAHKNCELHEISRYGKTVLLTK
jgi:4-amino-4-deoxy-L-arabinose transferase-like glycosyltransferase